MDFLVWKIGKWFSYSSPSDCLQFLDARSFFGIEENQMSFFRWKLVPSTFTLTCNALFITLLFSRSLPSPVVRNVTRRFGIYGTLVVFFL